LLARTQSLLVAADLERLHTGLQVELTIVKTGGDAVTDQPLHDLGGKGLFTRELEQALLDGAVDFAVHSYKDVPVTMPLVDSSALLIAATPAREDPRDVLVVRCGVEGQSPTGLDGLVAGATVGTGSLRRKCQLLRRRPDLIVQPIRGNIDTRLRKLEEGQFDAIVLAMAGLHRTRLFDAGRMCLLDPAEMLPAPGQGALALQCRHSDDRTRQLLAPLHDEATDICVRAERELVRLLEGDCRSPIAALATVNDGAMHLRAAIGARDGGLPVFFSEAIGSADRFQEVANDCWNALMKADHVCGEGIRKNSATEQLNPGSTSSP
jgi:hydroxymethylbilane synthase